MVIQDTQEFAKEMLKNFKETSRKDDVLHHCQSYDRLSSSIVCHENCKNEVWLTGNDFARINDGKNKHGKLLCLLLYFCTKKESTSTKYPN